MQAWAQVSPQLETQERRARCLEAYASAERDLAVRVTELEGRRNSGYLVMGGSGGGWLYCVYRLRSIPGAVACTGIFGLTGGSGYAYNQELNQMIKKIQDAATIMSIYSSIKDSRDETNEVIGYMRDLRIDVRHEQFAKENAIRAMENASLCDSNGVPNATYEDFLSLTRPGDI